MKGLWNGRLFEPRSVHARRPVRLRAVRHRIPEPHRRPAGADVVRPERRRRTLEPTLLVSRRFHSVVRYTLRCYLYRLFLCC